MLTKVKLSLCLTNWALRHEGVWGSGFIDPRFLDLGTSWRWSASHPGPFTPREGAPGTHWIGGWVDRRANLDDLEKRKSRHYRDSNSDPSVIQPVGGRYTDYAIRAPDLFLVTCQKYGWIQLYFK
jgi:hypothetical protein